MNGRIVGTAPQRRNAAHWPLVPCVLAAALCLAPRAALADGSAWLAEPGTGFVNVSYVYQTADEFYREQVKRPTPAGGEDLSQGTVWVNLDYAFTDTLAIDLQTGWARSDFVVLFPGPAPEDGYSGLVDTTVGLTWRAVDEAIDDAPSVAFRIGGIIAGNYDTGSINSLGDGGDGYEASIIVGRFLGDRFGLSGELGYRQRDNDIPSAAYANVSALWLVNERFTLGLDYQHVNSETALDIGAPGFSPARFPELEEDIESLGVRLFLNLGNVGLNLFHGRVVDGRNTAANGITGATVSYLFDTF